MALPIMIQGTTSDAGKSVVATGLCRLLRDRGYRIAPFKPQNMALNSSVTCDGGEIGRAQAVQAYASGIEPHTDMNPVLLKPNSDKGAQVIIQGHAIGNMDALQYHDFKPQAMDYVLESYQRLSSQYDVVVIEGAGSPAEINLRVGDIANMGFATRVNAPVLLVADIDRGGVFAHLLGTMQCLDPAEQKLIAGFIINRFRGDESLLVPGIDWLREQTGVATLGVLPYLSGLHIEAEDALNNHSINDLTADQLTVVVPRVPRISNHTDFDVLRLHPDVNFQFINPGETPPPCDLLILPGTKNTIHDLNWLLDNQWQPYIMRHLRYGGKLMGICGGMQMLGKAIHDPQGLEGSPGSQAGLGLLDFQTTLEPVKQLRRVSGRLIHDGSRVNGYEIHVGTTHGKSLENPAIEINGRSDGAISHDNQILCTYLHGVFDHPEACLSLLNWAGSSSARVNDYEQRRDHEINRVAEMLEQSLDIDDLLSTLNIDNSRISLDSDNG